MNKKELFDSILGILYQAKEDKRKLEQIYDFLIDEIYEEEEKIEIPEKHKKLIYSIAQSIDTGLVCYINKKTLEVEEIPKGIPIIYKYEQLVKTLDEKVQWTSEGISCFTTWCDIEPKTCPFPEEFCECKNLPDDDFDFDVNELPF